MSATTYDDVIGILGDIDDLLVYRIVATGATTPEVAEAFACFEIERQFGQPRRPGAPPGVAAVRDLLYESLDQTDEYSWFMDDAAP